MDSTLSELFEVLVRWMFKFPHLTKTFRWSGSHLSVVQKYVLRLCLNSDSKLVRSSSANLFDKSLWRQKEPTQAHREFLAFFAQELQKFFLVPTLDQLLDSDKTLRKNEIIASFIHFLLQLLYCKSDFRMSGIDSLVKELRFLVAVLGDTILLCNEHEQFQNLLTEFEEVANEAGTWIYSLLFSVLC